MELIDNIISIKDFKKVKRCEICDRKLIFSNRKFCFCVGCWLSLPKSFRVNLNQAKEECNVEKIKKLAAKSYNFLKIYSELSTIKNCSICGKKLSFTERNPVPTSICSNCISNQSEKWQEKMSHATDERRYDLIKTLADSAVKGDHEYEIDDFLIPKHGSFDYKGGHPDFSTLTSVSLTDKPEGVVAFDNRTKNILFTIKWDNITNISADKEVVTKSSAGLSAVGLLAGRPDLTVMGAAWKNNKENIFLNIGYRHSGMETTISFEGQKAYEAAAYYITQASKYRGERTEDNGNTAQAAQVSSDPVDQIKKLADLKDAGVLTEEEFQSKKKDLLAAI
jgi:hypothetical protein